MFINSDYCVNVREYTLQVFMGAEPQLKIFMPTIVIVRKVSQYRW